MHETQLNSNENIREFCGPEEVNQILLRSKFLQERYYQAHYSTKSIYRGSSELD